MRTYALFKLLAETLKTFEGFNHDIILLSGIRKREKTQSRLRAHELNVFPLCSGDERERGERVVLTAAAGAASHFERTVYYYYDLNRI